VHVRVLTNSLASTDVPVVHGAYVRYRPRLLACGAQLYEIRPGAVDSSKTRSALSSGVSLHAKAIVVDHRLVLVGSMNLDPRSRLSNTEIGVLIDSEAVAHDLDAWFDAATSLDHSFKPELDVPGDPAGSLSWVSLGDDGLVRYRSEPLASWWQRAVSGALGTVLPEDWL
jgi:putative cardiolipin synthase